MDFGVDPVCGTVTSRGWPPDLFNNIRTVSGESSPLRQTTYQREGNDRIVDLHLCETNVSRTHANHLFRNVDSRLLYQVTTSVSISDGRR